MKYSTFIAYTPAILLFSCQVDTGVNSPKAEPHNDQNSTLISDANVIQQTPTIHINSLHIDETFDFSTSKRIPISLSFPLWEGAEQIPASVFASFTTTAEGDLIPTVNSRLFKGYLIDGQLDTVVQVASDIDHILVQLVPNNGIGPENSLLAIDEDSFNGTIF